MPSPPPMVQLRDVVVRFCSGGSTFTLFKNLRLEVAAGRSLGISGPSGSGKSTLLNLCAGLMSPDKGVIVIDGIELTALSPPARDRLRIGRIGYIFQGFNLIPALSALENVELVLRLDGTLSRKARRTRAQALLHRVGLADRARHKAPRLSFGEMQRVGIARALANTPRLLLADEPTASLEPGLAVTIAQLLLDLARQENATMMVASHDPAILGLMQDRIAITDINGLKERSA